MPRSNAWRICPGFSATEGLLLLDSPRRPERPTERIASFKKMTTPKIYYCIPPSHNHPRRKSQPRDGTVLTRNPGSPTSCPLIVQAAILIYRSAYVGAVVLSDKQCIAAITDGHTIFRLKSICKITDQ